MLQQPCCNNHLAYQTLSLPYQRLQYDKQTQTWLSSLIIVLSLSHVTAWQPFGVATWDLPHLCIAAFSDFNQTGPQLKLFSLPLELGAMPALKSIHLGGHLVRAWPITYMPTHYIIVI